MKILFIDQYSETGGAQLCFLDLLPAIQDRGWTVHAALPGDGPFARRLRALQIPVIKISCGPYQSLTKSATDCARFPFDLATQVRSIHRQCADLMYVNGPRVLPGACLASMGRVPVLFHAHNRLNHFYERRLATWSLRASGATVVACCEFVAEPLAARKHSQEWLCYTQRRQQSKPLAQAFLPVSGFLRGLPGPVVIPNGTPDMGFRERSFDPTRLRAGMIGSASPQKGLATFVEVSKLLPEFQFVAVGQTARLSALHCLGWRDDIDNVLSQLDLLLIPSQQEGLPRVMLEAFSAGVPVIAFPAGGIVEAIRHGETGFLTSAFSAEAMATTIRAAIADIPALQRVAANARHQWEQHYNVTLYRRRLIEVMEQLASAHPPVCETAPLR